MKSEANIISFTDYDGLWLLLQKGDRKGLEGLYRAFAHELFVYGLTLANDTDFVQDCIQEVFIDLWKYHDTLGKAANVKAYLFRSMSHKLFRESTKRSKWKTEALLENTLPVRLESFESEQAGIQREHYLQVKLAGSLEKLPFRQKQVIQLLFFEQFSYEEVSKMMGINLRSVYTLAWKALSSLKKLLITLGLVLHLFL